MRVRLPAALRTVCMCLLMFAGLWPVATAQMGPPPEVQTLANAVAEMVDSQGDGPVETFIDTAMTADESRDRSHLAAQLSELRSAVAGRVAEIRILPAREGFRLSLSGPRGTAEILAHVTQARITRLELSNLSEAREAGAPGAGSHIVEGHLHALEASAGQPLETVLAEFEATRFSSGFMARTSPESRRALLEEIASAVAGAGAVQFDQRGDEIVITLGSPEGTREVVFTVAADEGFLIDTLTIRAADLPGGGLELTPETAADTFDRLAAEGFSGVAFVEIDGEVLVNQAYGMANDALGTPIGMDTVFGIGSTPLAFTMAAIDLLEQRGLLSYDDPIGRFFANVPADKQAITVDHLLRGQSGLPDFFDTEADWDPDLAWVDRDTAVARMMAQTLRFAPGEGNLHSHGAYGLLAAIVEVVSGETYTDFIRHNFLDPAGMTRTGNYGEHRGLAVTDFAVGHGPSSVGIPNIPPNWGPTSWLIMGSGGMYSTLPDMLRFYDYLRTGGVLDEEHAARYHRLGLVIGGSNRGFFIACFYNGADNTALVITNRPQSVNGATRLVPAMRAMIEATQ